jgi:L-seryl-tRNA(Ser) seleniumtransferase
VSMMAPGDEKIVGDRLHQVLSEPHTLKPVEPPAPPAANIGGRWDIEIAYVASKAMHTIHLQQDGNRLTGLHQGDFLTRDISGTISGDRISLASNVTERHGDALSYRFSGTITGETIAGSLDMGEYLGATWIGRRSSRS